MRFTLFSVLLTLGSASILPLAPEAGNIEAGVVLRENIPAGVKVYEFNATAADTVLEQAEGTSLNPAATGFGLQKRTDCLGSALCGGAIHSNCISAITGYADNAAYCGYTSRVNGHCTAIYTCSNYNGHCMYGWWIKQQLNKIYEYCSDCGSWTIPDGDVIGCRATLNYCGSCKSVG